MEPIVETLEVVAELDLYADDHMPDLLRRQSGQMHDIVPDVVGMSISNFEHDLTLTWAATDAEVARLDLPTPRVRSARWP